MPWYSVRSIFHWASLSSYEERITLWECDSFEVAITNAEREAELYTKTTEESGFVVAYSGLSQAYRLTGPPANGMEVFSLLRDSVLSPDEYLTRFFDTGDERQGST